MAFPPPAPQKNAPPPVSGGASESESTSSSSESESTSNASESKMKGAKMNPLRKWAASVAQGDVESGSGGDY